MASVPPNLEKRTPVLREAEMLETRLALDAILIAELVRDLNAKDRSLISQTIGKGPHHR